MAVESQELGAIATVHIHPPSPSSESSTIEPLDLALTQLHYEIEDTRLSECALILFARDTTESKGVVMKLLRDYADTRYCLNTLERRQQCQLEALERNRVFTTDIYIGLARIDYIDLTRGRFHISEIIGNPTQVGISQLDVHQGSFQIDEIIQNPTKEKLDPDAEYALIMEELPQNRRLDNLLDSRDKLSLRYYVQFLTEHVAYMHIHLVTALTAEDELQWGSYEQLRKKLMHNFGLLDLVLTENSHCRTSGWSEEMLEQLRETLGRLKNVLIWAFMQSCYHNHFEQRAKEQRIRCCHGDLKSPNIWILPSDQEDGGKDAVKILDAIDFNPAYSNIDTLSDFAMLVIDVQTRTGSALLADEMIEYYLHLTGQENEVAVSVLNYYLVEKAIVGAAISIVYDDAPDLGLSLLKVAEMRLNCLIDRRY
jgi:aminoglycoside phosphotransferase family enzyme